MSRKQQFERRKNPAEVILEWAGGADAGYFKVYDKEAKENIKLGAITFAVLTEKNCVGGWYEEKHCNAFSNEVGSLRNQDLTVRYFEDGKAKELCHGKYEDIKADLASKGIKYNKAVYIMVLESDKIETGTVGKIMLKGASAGAWFDVKEKGMAIKVADSVDGKKGSVKYKMPKFEIVDIAEDDDKEAEMAYEQVKAYFNAMPSTVTSEPELPPVDEDSIPF